MHATNLPLKISLLIVAMALGGPARAGRPVPETRANLPLTPAALQIAIDRYAPILTLHLWERYQPTCVESYLKVTEPFTYRDRDNGSTMHGLRLKGSDAEKEAAKAGDPAHAEAYVNVKINQQTTDIQYWFLYAYNGPGTAYIEKRKFNGGWEPIDKGSSARHAGDGDHELAGMGVHEGDWEHLTVTIDNKSGEVRKNGIYAASHDAGERHDMLPGATTRIQAYASRNGHATYLKPGREFNVEKRLEVIGFKLLNDTSVAGGRKIDYRGHCKLIGLHGEGASALAAAMAFKEPEYIAAHPGRWGRYKIERGPLAEVPGLGSLIKEILQKAGVYDELTFEAGPEPPWSKGTWTGGE